MPDATERDALIERIRTLQDDMTRLFAGDPHPLLASTLTMQQLKVVIVLTSEDSLSGQDLARRLGIGLGTVTGIVDRLVQQGMVTRFEDPDDRRVRRVRLTEDGQKVASDFTDTGAARLRDILRRLDMDTLRDFARILRTIQSAMRGAAAER